MNIRHHFIWTNLNKVIVNSTIYRKLRRYLKIHFGRDRYNITSSKNQNFVWYRIAKNGTRSLLYLLKEHADIEYSGHQVKYRPDKFSERFKFTIVRNPYDRLVSCYLNKVVGRNQFKACWGKSFQYFVHYISKKNLKKAINQHIRLQTVMFPEDRIDYIGRFENYENEVNKILDIIGVKAKLPHYNKSNNKRHYSAYYNEETKEIVDDIYKDDLEKLNYSFNKCGD